MGAYMSSGLISAGNVLKPAGANQSWYSKRTNISPSVPLLSHHLDSTNGAIFGVVSWPSVRRNINAPRAAVSKRSGPPISGLTLGLIVASVAVVLSLLLLFDIWRRRRKRRSKNAGDQENPGVLPASHEIGSDGTSFANHPNDSPGRSSNDSSLISQPSKATSSVSLLTLPISKVSDGKSRRARPLIRPPPLQLSPLLYPEREARRGNSFTVATSRTTRSMGSSNRCSFLPNPWDGSAKPSHAAFEQANFWVPHPAPAVLRVKSFKAGLPQTPRERRTFLPSELRLLELTQVPVAVKRIRSNSGQGPAPI